MLVEAVTLTAGLVFSFQGFVSKTLDSASAQFAASALMTSEQLMGFKMKDDVVLGIGVNGVLPASGEDKDICMASCLHACIFVHVVIQPPSAVLTCFLSLPRSIQGLTPQRHYTDSACTYESVDSRSSFVTAFKSYTDFRFPQCTESSSNCCQFCDNSGSVWEQHSINCTFIGPHCKLYHPNKRTTYT